ncbi:DNA cytosine methyltransferase [Virgibacillus salexigens]|nr:DNA (cytosine-5-)-methyltransferase [Virgibacillus massiliensis]
MKSIELFAGIGGISLGAEWAGIETIALCEREPFCQKVLNKHWPDVPIFDDIRTLNRQALEERGIDVGTIDIISGGFPCQPYSIAGKRKGTEDDRDLWPEMFRIIKEIKPAWVVGENVANFVNMELDRTISDLESIGYEVQSFVIPACAVNAKHRRDRTFIVAHSNSIGRNNGGNNWKERQVQNEQHRNDKESQSEGVGRINRTREICSVLSDSTSERLEGDSRRIPKRERLTWKDRWATEPDVGRVANGISNRVDRLKGLGNAVVPQQIYPIFKAIVEINKLNEMRAK